MRKQPIVDIKTEVNELVDQYRHHCRGAVFKTPDIIRQQDLLTARGHQIPGMPVPQPHFRPYIGSSAGAMAMALMTLTTGRGGT